MSSINIICLHGLGQNASVMKKKLSKLLKATKEINLYYLNGPAVLPEPPYYHNGSAMLFDKNGYESRAYWIFNQKNPKTGLHYLEESLHAFIDLGKEIKHVDGIIGFSQGGVFADYICKLYSCGKIPFDIRFTIFISADKFNGSEYDNINISPNIKTLHIYGSDDDIILSNLSEELAQSYPNKEIFVHSGAHIIPSTSTAKAVVKKLICCFL
jgi:predicted esterase